MNNPLLKERVSLSDVQNALRHVHTESQRLLDEAQKAERGGDAEMQFIIDMSGFEAYLTNFCKDFRERFI